MSDDYIRLIPSDRHWQPALEAATAAVAYLAGLFSGPGDAVEHVGHEYYEKVTLIDAGESTTRITCSRCDRDIDPAWFYGLFEENGGSFDTFEVTVPCCGAAVALYTLRFDWPVGFARFEVSAMNATRAKYELDARELADVAALLGHPVIQILARY